MSFCLCFFGPRFFVGVLCLIAVLSALSESYSAAVPITLLPNNPVGVVGKDMHLNCTLTDTNLTWQDLVFTIVEFSQFTHHPIPASAVRRLDEWNVELTLQNLTQSQHRATVFCKDRHRLNVYDAQIIAVVGAPAVPMIYYHRYLNWKEFVFRWNVSRPTNGFDTKYIAWFKTTLQPDFTPCDDIAAGGKCKCTSNGVDNSCHIDLSGELQSEILYDGYLQFKVNATNIAGSATSENMRLFIEEYIEPAPVTELRVTPSSDADTGEFVDVVSCRTLGASRHSYAFKIYTTSKENQTSWPIVNDVKSVDDRGTRRITLEGLDAYTVYNLTIRIKFEYVGRRRGYWSKWSNIQFRSHEEPPAASPAVCPCCFEVDEDSIQRTAFIYFKPLTKNESRGIVAYYMEYTPASSAFEDTSLQQNNSSSSDMIIDNEITFLVSNKTQVVVSDYSVMERTAMVQWNKSDATVFRLDLRRSGPYQLKVNAKTKAGHSLKKPSTVIIPTRTELLKIQPPSNCSVMSVDGVDENRIVFRWNKVKSTDADEDLGTVTIFWCKAFLNSLRCQQPLNWNETNPNVTSFHVTLSESYEGYLFGIGRVLKNGYSSGIHWTCSYFKRNAGIQQL
jgi:hypothetical protein